MTLRSRILLPFLLLATLATAAHAAKVLHVNAEVVRQGKATGVHTRGSALIVGSLVRNGHTVTQLGSLDLNPRAKTRVDLGKVGQPDLVTISATMSNSVPTVHWIVKGLVAQGVSRSQIVIGGQATSKALADRLGVHHGAVPATATRWADGRY